MALVVETVDAVVAAAVILGAVVRLEENVPAVEDAAVEEVEGVRVSMTVDVDTRAPAVVRDDHLKAKNKISKTAKGISHPPLTQLNPGIQHPPPRLEGQLS